MAKRDSFSCIKPSVSKWYVYNRSWVTYKAIMMYANKYAFSILNYFEGQIITFKKINSIIWMFKFKFIHIVEVWQSVLLGNIWFIFDFFPWTPQFTGHWFDSCKGFISFLQDLTRHHLFLSFTFQFPVSVSSFIQTETSIIFHKNLQMQKNKHSFAFQWSSFIMYI